MWLRFPKGTTAIGFGGLVINATITDADGFCYADVDNAVAQHFSEAAGFALAVPPEESSNELQGSTTHVNIDVDLTAKLTKLNSELEEAKTELANVTNERDQLKTEHETTLAKLQALTSNVSGEQVIEPSSLSEPST